MYIYIYTHNHRPVDSCFWKGTLASETALSKFFGDLEKIFRLRSDLLPMPHLGVLQLACGGDSELPGTICTIWGPGKARGFPKSLPLSAVRLVAFRSGRQIVCILAASAESNLTPVVQI